MYPTDKTGLLSVFNKEVIYYLALTTTFTSGYTCLGKHAGLMGFVSRFKFFQGNKAVTLAGKVFHD
jgi:hypothetical protein